jgi:hypothetical protein
VSDDFDAYLPVMLFVIIGLASVVFLIIALELPNAVIHGPRVLRQLPCLAGRHRYGTAKHMMGYSYQQCGRCDKVMVLPSQPARLTR